MKKLLIVDDEKDVCNFAKSFFQGKNLNVFCALSGEDAIPIIEKERPNIVILDIKMKGISGIDVLKKIKEIDPKIDVIMVTALDDINLMEEAKKLGASDYITKPLVLEELEKRISERVAKFSGARK